MRDMLITEDSYTRTQSGAMGDIFNTMLKPNVPLYASSLLERCDGEKEKATGSAPHTDC